MKFVFDITHHNSMSLCMEEKKKIGWWHQIVQQLFKITYEIEDGQISHRFAMTVTCWVSISLFHTRKQTIQSFHFGPSRFIYTYAFVYYEAYRYIDEGKVQRFIELASRTHEWLTWWSAIRRFLSSYATIKNTEQRSEWVFFCMCNNREGASCLGKYLYKYI